jgi:hypothetical protein
MALTCKNFPRNSFGKNLGLRNEARSGLARPSEVPMELDFKQRFVKTAEAVVREADEWDCAVIFEPDTPRLCMLNATAWLIYELCDGRSLGSIGTTYADLFGNKISKEEARIQATSGIQQLLKFNLIEPVSRKAISAVKA